MSDAPHRIRLSPALRALIKRVGPNISTAHRALLLLGAHAAGYDVAPCRSDLARVLSEELDEPVCEAIERLLSNRRPAVDPSSYSQPTKPETKPLTAAQDNALEYEGNALEREGNAPEDELTAGDPFARIGIDV